MQTIMETININKEVLLAIEWGIVPLILIGMLVRLLTYQPGRNLDPKIKQSSTSGKYAGLLIFTLFVLSRKDSDLVFSLTMPAYEFDLFVVLCAIAVGTVVSMIFDLMRHHTVIGVYTLFSVSTITIFIYSYLFIQELRNYLIFITIGMILGIFIFRIFYPGNTRPKPETSDDVT